MNYTFDDLDELEEFIINIGESGGTGHFRGIEIRCDHYLGLRRWSVYGHKITAFTADIGPDDLAYTLEKLIAAGVFDTPGA